MDSVLRGVILYFVLLIVFRIAGRRTLAEITTFDFVLLLIISEATQNYLVGKDYSLTNALLLIITLVGIDVGLSLLKQKIPVLDKWMDGTPLVIVEQGRPLKDRMQQARVDESEVLSAARERQGLERMNQIKYAVLERHGGISIIPKESEVK